MLQRQAPLVIYAHIHPPTHPPTHPPPPSLPLACLQVKLAEAEARLSTEGRRAEQVLAVYDALDASLARRRRKMKEVRMHGAGSCLCVWRGGGGGLFCRKQRTVTVRGLL
jgi:hypothetical protein